MQCRLRDRRSRLFSLGLRPCPLRTEIPPDSLNLLIMLCTVEGEISKSLPIFLWGTLFLNISIIFSRICWQTGDPRPIFAPKGLDLSWMLLLYQIIITITCWHQLFQITSLFNQFTSLLALNCSCPNFFWNVLQVWMTGKDVYLQMTWSWPDKTWNILCSYCLQWNISQSKFRNHYFLFLFAFSILSQLFLIWGCIKLLLLLLLLGGLLLLGYQIAPLFHLSAALHTHAQMRNKVYLGRPPTVLITSFSSWLADSRAPRPSAGNFLRPRKSSWWYCACVELVRPHSSAAEYTLNAAWTRLCARRNGKRKVKYTRAFRLLLLIGNVLKTLEMTLKLSLHQNWTAGW